ncbi:unnamed protein product [marine sediment metagenome]|uniref:Uncharacterized protein n=1 Tax=marine sediment metagenome TaxID=412755 RepID=X0YYQ8_9ZZZZ
MNKKIIILVFIAIILINTIYWISLIPRLFPPYSSESRLIKGLYFTNEEYAVKNIIDILAITDAVLIATSFMIILLYKNKRVSYNVKAI